MDGLIIFITLIAGVLQIILFFKVWGMCNDVDKINKHQAKKEEPADMDKLIFLSKTNSPSFATELTNKIYCDFQQSRYDGYYTHETHAIYEKSYAKWTKRCEYYGWEFPTIFRECDTWEKFSKKYLFAYNRDID